MYMLFHDVIYNFQLLSAFKSLTYVSFFRGGFVIYDADKPAQFIGGLQAQLPSKVHRKVFDFSQKMPSVLKATLLPRLHLWDDPFHNECPALEDVALYLFPDDNITRSVLASIAWLYMECVLQNHLL